MSPWNLLKYSIPFSSFSDAKIQNKFIFVCSVTKPIINHSIDFQIKRASKEFSALRRRKKNSNVNEWLKYDNEMLNIIVCVHTLAMSAWHICQTTLRVCQIATLQVAFSLRSHQFIAMKSIQRCFVANSMMWLWTLNTPRIANNI